MLRTPKRGLGRAYIDALPFIRGRYVLMGDCDCTYDFRELAPFVEKFRGGAEFVMGSRFRGYIEPGSMPPLHRYLGTPVTTWILNVIFGSRFSDIHCGMRGITKAALERMDLRSQSWEYASEMVLKSVHMHLRTEEVPIRFLKDREGRLSHHKRVGLVLALAGRLDQPARDVRLRRRLLPVQAGADPAGARPAADAAAVVRAGDARADHVLAALDAVRAVARDRSACSASTWAILSQVFFDYDGAATARWFRRFPYNRTVALSALAVRRGPARWAGLLTAQLRPQRLSAARRIDRQQPRRHRHPVRRSSAS